MKGWKNNRPSDWKKIRPWATALPELPDYQYCSGFNTGVEAGADAIVKEIAIKLQSNYNLPDEGMFHKKLGDFIKELMEEVKDG